MTVVHSADAQRGHHHGAVEIDRGEPHVVRERRRGVKIAGCGLLIERVADHQPDRDDEHHDEEQHGRREQQDGAERAAVAEREQSAPAARAAGPAAPQRPPWRAPCETMTGTRKSASHAAGKGCAAGIERPSRSPQDENWHANRKTSPWRSCADLVSSKRHAIPAASAFGKSAGLSKGLPIASGQWPSGLSTISAHIVGN